MLPPSPIAPVARCGEVDGDRTRPWQEVRGPCVCCGLELTDRDGMRGYLTTLLRSRRAACEAAELHGLTEDHFAAMLGPNWRLQCRRGGGEAGMAAAAMTGARGGVGELLGAEGTAHHNCLIWSGLLAGVDVSYTTQLYDAVSERLPERIESGPTTGAGVDEGASACYWARAFPSHPVVHVFSDLSGPEGAGARETPHDEAARRLAAILLSIPCQMTSPNVRGEGCRTRCCAVCGRGASQGSGGPVLGLRRCEAATRASPRSCRRRCCKYFHFPCALLAGAGACVVYGVDEGRAEGVEVWCGACRRALEEARLQAR
ncbi:unnamed protein product [Phytomonas sp. EM1]|nr:unnamed protein product [Phytomonas sp. EM1]|eukprot:CCW63970.1 unnamed protein product [Phytomonas sp. isolate EM1]